MLRYQIEEQRQLLEVGQLLDLLAGNAGFRSFYNRLLADSPLPGFFWEHPPLKASGLEEPYEFTLIRSEALPRVRPQPEAFAQHFADGRVVAAFPNLGGDARLIAPAPIGPPSHYTHLAAFARQAPEAQRDAFWQLVAEETIHLLPTGKRWLSTAGMGVYWLHARLDTRPKYYRHAPYRTA